MAKKITELQLIASITDSLNFPSDNGIQTYRATALQLKNYILAAGSIVRSMIAAEERIPIGSVSAYVGTTAPSGWLIMDGSAISRTTYADLYAIIGDKFGEGDGSTTFNLPDMRGRFIRGFDNGAGNDPDAASRLAMDGNSGASTGDNIGSYQADAMQGHRHETGGSGSKEFLYTRGSGGVYSNPFVAGSVVDRTTTPQLDPITDGSNGTPRTTSETRPVNLSMNYIIRY